MDGYIEYENELDNEALPYGASDTKVFKEAICDCPVCKDAGRNGQIYESEKNYYCSNARDDKGCDFLLYKNNIEKLIRRDIRRDEVRDLCEDGSFRATCTKINDDTKTYEGIFSLKPMGKYFGLKLSFPD